MARMSGADRRNQIVEAAIDAMLERGVALAATRDVTRALGVGSGLLHHYFLSWADLRAEAVRVAAEREIDEVAAMVSALPPRQALTAVADWMVEDDDMRHWRLWLNALDEANRDAGLAEVMNAALANWHRLIARLLAGAMGDHAEAPGICDAAAWRLIALMDGLAGAMLIKGSIVTRDMARHLIETQMRAEIDVAAG
ncbi:MAG: TetR family transcriptional regulator C-terminal domain-containing protein [Pseudomonadota bacterium]